jgi:hypothetical protein
MVCAFCQAGMSADALSGEIIVPMTAVNDDLVAWLLQGDPSVRWRVHRDILGSSESRIRAERAKVANEGWGAELISLQDPDGRLSLRMRPATLGQCVTW